MSLGFRSLRPRAFWFLMVLMVRFISCAVSETDLPSMKSLVKTVLHWLGRWAIALCRLFMASALMILLRYGCSVVSFCFVYELR